MVSRTGGLRFGSERMRSLSDSGSFAVSNATMASKRLLGGGYVGVRKEEYAVIKRFRTKTGVFLSVGYLILLLFTVLSLLFSAPDAMSILAPMVLTAPWSFLLFEIVPESVAAAGGPVAFFLIFILSAALNAAILYLAGWLFTQLITQGEQKEQ